MRYISAFFTALKMTIRGETVPKRFQDSLYQWVKRTPRHIETVYVVAEGQGLDRVARDKITMKLDGRQVSMQTVLASVDYHIREEYPYLLNNITEGSITAIYASNINDQYNVMRLKEADSIRNTPVQDAVEQLYRHLQAIPSTNNHHS